MQTELILLQTRLYRGYLTRLLMRFILLVLGLAAGTAWADTSATWTGHNQQIYEFYANSAGDRRFGTAETYQLVRDNQVYLVTDVDSQLRTISLDDVLQLAARLQRFLPTTVATTSELSLQFTETKNQKTIAGITGTEYRLNIDHNGRQFKKTMVLTDNTKAVAMHEALSDWLQLMAKELRGQPNAQTIGELENFYAVIEMFDEIPEGAILSIDDTFVLQQVSDDDLDSSLFSLPSAPMTQLELLQMIALGQGPVSFMKNWLSTFTW